MSGNVLFDLGLEYVKVTKGRCRMFIKQAAIWMNSTGEQHNVQVEVFLMSTGDHISSHHRIYIHSMVTHKVLVIR